jgi:hypothetical protein
MLIPACADSAPGRLGLFFRRRHDFSASMLDDAHDMQVAQTHGKMDTYAACLRLDAPAAARVQVAQYFQGQAQHGKAAAQYELAGRLPQCVAHLMAHAKQVRPAVLSCCCASSNSNSM